MMETQGATSITPTGIIPVPNGFKLSSSSITSSSSSSSNESSKFYKNDTSPFSSSSSRLSSSTSSPGVLKSGNKTVVLSSNGNKCVMNGNKMLLSSSSLTISDKIITTATATSWNKATVSRRSEARNGSLTISSSTPGVNYLASEKLRSNSDSLSMSAEESSDQNGNSTFGDTSVFSVSSVGSMSYERIADDSGTLNGENSIDMFAATPAAKLIRQMIMTEADSSDTILVPATQPVQDQKVQDAHQIQIVVDSDQEQLDSPDSSVQHVSMDEEDFPEDQILVRATQAVSQESYDCGSRIEIEESVVTEESSSSDESNHARGNETFTVSPSPMKLSTKRFQKVDLNIPLKLGSVEEESSQPFNSTFVLENVTQKESNNHKGGLRNCTFSRDTSPVNDIGGDGTSNSSENSLEVEENLSQIQEPSLFSLNESQNSTLEGAPVEASSLETPIAQNQLEPMAQNEAVRTVQDQIDRSAQDQVVPLAQDETVPMAQNEVMDGPIAQKTLNLNAVRKNVPPVLSTPKALPSHVIQLSTTPSSPRKGKKLYKEPSFPVKRNSAPSPPRSPHSSDSEAEEDGEQSLYSRFPHLNNPKRGKDTKADREALFETENPLPSTSAPLVRHNAREQKKSKGKVSKSESFHVSSKGRRIVHHASKKLLDSMAAKVSQPKSVMKPTKKKKKKESVQAEPDIQVEKGRGSVVEPAAADELLERAFLVKSKQVSDASKLQTQGASVQENSELEMPNLEIAVDNPVEVKTDEQAAPCLPIVKNPEEQVKPKRPRGRPPLKKKNKPVASKASIELQSNHAYLEELPDLSDEAASDHPTAFDEIPVAKTTRGRGRPKRKKIEIVELIDECQEASAAKKTKKLPELVLEMEPAPPTPPKPKSDQENKKSELENDVKSGQENGDKSEPENGVKSDQEIAETSDQENGKKSEQDKNEEVASSPPRTKRMRKASSSDTMVAVPDVTRSRNGRKKPVEIVISTSPPPPTPPKPKSEQDNDAASSRPRTQKRVRKPSVSEDKAVPEVKKSKKVSKKPAEIIISSSPPPPTPPRGRNPRTYGKKDVKAQEPVPIVADANNQEVRRSGRERKPRDFGEGFIPLEFRFGLFK